MQLLKKNTDSYVKLDNSIQDILLREKKRDMFNVLPIMFLLTTKKVIHMACIYI